MDIIKQSQTQIIGRMSDGSDRQEIALWDVTVQDNGKTYYKQFDHEPLDTEIIIAEMQDITPKEDLLQAQVDALNIAVASLLGT
jgi:hypothetical protein